MTKIIGIVTLMVSLFFPTIGIAQQVIGPIKILNTAQKKFSIDGVKYKVSEGVRIKELFNETNILLFAQLHTGDYLKIDFIQNDNQPKKVTKAYLVPQ